MIDNTNKSKMPTDGEFIDVKKYIGVASIKILAVNPNNETLRKYGWQIPQTSDEPSYVLQKQTEKGVKTLSRVRFLVQIQDLPDKPVIGLDFWVRPEIWIDKTGKKCKIIDSFGRTAWATKEEVRFKTIPQYANGPASINSDYKGCHPGEEELIAFIRKFLNITPLQIFDKNKNAYVSTDKPGHSTFDHWADICNGNVTEIIEMINHEPDNLVKVCLGIRFTDDNKSYQTFLNSYFLGNGARPDSTTGEYTSVQKAIEKYQAGNTSAVVKFSSKPVREWSVGGATEVKDNSENEEALEDAFDNGTSYDENDDLPFD